MKEIVLGAFADEAGAALTDQIAAMRDNGIRHLEARTIGSKNFIDFTCAEAKEVKEQLDANGHLEHRLAAGQDRRHRPAGAASG